MSLDHLRLDRETREDCEELLERANNFEGRGCDSVAEAIRASAAEKVGMDADALADALDGPEPGTIADLRDQYDLQMLTDRSALETEIDRLTTVANAAEHRLPKHHKKVETRLDALKAIHETVTGPYVEVGSWDALAARANLDSGDGRDALTLDGGR